MKQFTEYKEYISKEVATDLLTMIKSYEDRFNYRTGETAHKGFDGKLSKYSNMWNIPKEIVEYIKKNFPKTHRQDYNGIVINRYLPGDYMCEHIDAGGHIKNAVLILEDSENGFMNKDKQDNEHFVQDEIGTLIDFETLSLKHRVPTIKDGKTRYVIINVFKM